MDESLVLEEAQMLPSPGPRVMDRLISRAAGRAGKPAAGLEADLEVDLLCLDIEAYVRDAPGRLQAKRHCEQARLGPHGTPPSAGIREHYSAKVHRCRQQIRRVRRCDIYSLRAGRASRREHNIWCCPKRHQTRQTHTNREGTENSEPWDLFGLNYLMKMGPTVAGPMILNVTITGSVGHKS